MNHDARHRYEWNTIPWHKLEVRVFKLQKRIYQATTRGETKKAHRLQKLLASSWSAKSLAVRRVTRLCTKSPVRNLTQWSTRTFWSLFDAFSRSKSPVLHTKSVLKGYFLCKAREHPCRGKTHRGTCCAARFVTNRRRKSRGSLPDRRPTSAMNVSTCVPRFCSRRESQNNVRCASACGRPKNCIPNSMTTSLARPRPKRFSLWLCIITTNVSRPMRAGVRLSCTRATCSSLARQAPAKRCWRKRWRVS